MQFINRYAIEISQQIEKYRFQEKPSELYQPINYILSNGGKRLRPILTMMATDAFSGNWSVAIKPALAIEYFHNFTLIHDDIMDDAPLRRGNPTIHTLHGVNVAILSGDALLIKSYQFFEDLEPNIFKKCIQIFSDTGIKICEGQQMDVNFENQPEVNYDEYITMITYKTGVLTAAALKIGALIGGASEQDSEYLYQFGRDLGVAFQMKDDYLDVFGENEDFGKRLAGDIYENKKTILYLLALQNSDEIQREELRGWYETTEETQEKVDAVRYIFKATGADQKTLELVQKYNYSALEFLNKTSLSEEKKKPFLELADYLLNRTI